MNPWAHSNNINAFMSLMDHWNWYWSRAIASSMNQMGHGVAAPVNQMGVGEPVATVGPVQPDNMGDNIQDSIYLDDDEQDIMEIMVEMPERPPIQQREINNDRRERERDRGVGRGQYRVRSRSWTRDLGMDRGRSNYNRDNWNRGDDFRDRSTKWTFNQPLIPPSVMMQSYPNVMQSSNNMMHNNIVPQNLMPHNPMNPVPGTSGMMMNAQTQTQSLPLYFTTGVVLPRLPGTLAPPRSEHPQSCLAINVKGFPSWVSADVVHDLFQRFGTIKEIKMGRSVVCVQFEKPTSVEMAIQLSGCRFKLHNQTDNEATTLYIAYGLATDEPVETANNKRKREAAPPRIDPYTPQAFTSVGDKIKSDTEFADAAPTLVAWLERGECTKKNSNNFYSLIQASNNQLRRLFNEKMQIDEEFLSVKNTMKEKFAFIILQFEQVAKILTAAKHQRVSDHFSKQQRRSIEMWLKMTEELDNIKEDFNSAFNDEEVEGNGKNVVSLEKYELLQVAKESLAYELEGYKNVANLAKDEAERKFERFKAHFIAQQALLNNQTIYPPLPISPSVIDFTRDSKCKSAPPISDAQTSEPFSRVPSSEAKLISIISAFLIVHPLGASLDYIVSYVNTLVPDSTQTSIHDILCKYDEIFERKTTGVGACIEHKWGFAIFDLVKA